MLIADATAIPNFSLLIPHSSIDYCLFTKKQIINFQSQALLATQPQFLIPHS